MKNYFNHSSLWKSMWNALNAGAVGYADFFIIIRYLIQVYFAKSYFIPRVMDTDSTRNKNFKKTIVKYLIPFINEKTIENGIESVPSISKVTNNRVYFNYFTRSVNDKDRLIKILLTQALSIGGIEIAKNVRLDLSNNMIRFNIQDHYGSSEVVFEDVGVRVEMLNNLREVCGASFIGDMDILNYLEEEEKIVSAKLEAKFVLGLHVIKMDNSIMADYKTKEDVLIQRFAHFIRQLDILLPYGKYRSSINWDELIEKKYLNIIN